MENITFSPGSIIKDSNSREWILLKDSTGTELIGKGEEYLIRKIDSFSFCIIQNNENAINIMNGYDNPESVYQIGNIVGVWSDHFVAQVHYYLVTGEYHE